MKFITLTIGPLSNNCYILSGDEKNAVIIDPAGNYPKITETLTGAGFSPSYVLLSHGHFDHIGAVKQLQDVGAEVWLHPNDRDKITSFRRTTPFVPDKNLVDGQILNLAGLEIKVIHTPGHTSGGICFHINNMLFSGDTLFHGNFGRTDLPSGNFEQLKRSVKEKLFTLPPETIVYPGHGGSPPGEEETTIGEERLNNSILRL